MNAFSTPTTWQRLARTLALLATVALTATAAIVQLASRADAETSNQRLVDAVLSGTAFAIMRHALAPGTGDPSNFDVNDCTTQRNLSDRGRDQSRRIGARLKSLGLDTAAVFTSQWCRCRETAELLGLGDVTELPALNSFFQSMDQRTPQTNELKRWLSERGNAGPLMLVTHQVNISALTGSFTSSGEIVVARLQDDGTVEVLGSIETR